MVAMGIWRLLEFEYSRSSFRKEMAEEEYKRQTLLFNSASDLRLTEEEEEDAETTTTTTAGQSNLTPGTGTVAQRRLSPTSNARNNNNDYEQQESAGLERFLSLHWNEINRRHNLLNCVRNDTTYAFNSDDYNNDNNGDDEDDDDEEYEEEQEDEFNVDNENDVDFCQRLWHCFANLCCNTCCMCWCIWCGTLYTRVSQCYSIIVPCII